MRSKGLQPGEELLPEGGMYYIHGLSNSYWVYFFKKDLRNLYVFRTCLCVYFILVYYLINISMKPPLIFSMSLVTYLMVI